MADTNSNYTENRAPSGAFLGLVAAALLFALIGLGWSWSLQSHLSAAEQQNTAALQEQNAKLQAELDQTNARLRATTETLGTSVAGAQKQIEARTQSILVQQKEESARLEKQQQATNQQVAAVSSDVSSVKTDVGGVKTDVANTKTDLDATKTQMQRMMGDEHVMSGDIATTRDQLETLKHKGDRNYYEFTLSKNAKPTTVGSISIQLKKVDDKHSKYTLLVNSDDRHIEKKDRNIDEPIQFFSGKDPALFEIVVNVLNKNQVSGYLSTPKNAPAPSAPSGE